MKMPKSTEEIKTIVKLDLPFTLDSVTTAYAEQVWTHTTYIETDDMSETVEVTQKGPLQLKNGLTKAQLITQYQSTIAELEAKCIKETTELNDIIDKLEAE